MKELGLIADQDSVDREGFDPRPILRRLFGGQMTPANVARALSAGFRRDLVAQLEGYERLRAQQAFFEEGNFLLTRRQAVGWDDMVICFEGLIEQTGYRIPETDRLSNNRLVPPGSIKRDEDKVWDLNELAF